MEKVSALNFEDMISQYPRDKCKRLCQDIPVKMHSERTALDYHTLRNLNFPPVFEPEIVE